MLADRNTSMGRSARWLMALAATADQTIIHPAYSAPAAETRERLSFYDADEDRRWVLAAAE